MQLRCVSSVEVTTIVMGSVMERRSFYRAVMRGGGSDEDAGVCKCLRMCAAANVKKWFMRRLTILAL